MKRLEVCPIGDLPVDVTAVLLSLGLPHPSCRQGGVLVQVRHAREMSGPEKRRRRLQQVIRSTRSLKRF